MPLFYNVMDNNLYRDMVKIAYNVDNKIVRAGDTPEITISDILFYNSSEAYQEDSITVSASTIVDNHIIEVSEKSKLSIYPNPVDNILTVNIPNSDSEQATVSLVSLTGQVVFQAVTNELKYQIDMQRMEKGVYILFVLKGNDTFTEKVIKN